MSQTPLDRLRENLQNNTSFSSQWLGLQLAVDSTSLGEFKTCPRKYYYSILLGYAPKGENIHLAFGLAVHASLERYHHARAQGAGHEDALDATLAWALQETWDPALRKAKAIFQSDPNKNRFTLIRTLVAYLDHYQNDALVTTVLASGKPAVELSFTFPSGYASRLTGEEIAFCGHLDRLGQLNDQNYIADAKTTKHGLDPRFWQQFAPHNQFGLYDLAGSVVLDEPTRGLVVDGMQILVGESRFGRQIISRDDRQRREWHNAAMWWLVRMEDCAEALVGIDNHNENSPEALHDDPALAYPMNDTSCDRFGGCLFREVCSRTPGARQGWLDANYTKRVWDPLQRRGDI